MSRPFIPTAIADVKGSFIAHPERARSAEPDVSRTKPIGEPPAHLTHEEMDIWSEVSAQLLPGVGKESDRIAFEALVILIGRMRAGMLKATEMMSIVSLCARFAMTPADRAKVQVEKPAKSSLGEFLHRGQYAPQV
jgi:hypothetical protein